MTFLLRYRFFLLLLALPLFTFADNKSEVAEYYEEALNYYDEQAFPSAIITLKNALKVNPKHLSSRVLLGKIYIETSEGANAEKELQIALDMGGDENLIAVPLAKSFNLQNKYQETIQQFSNKTFPSHVKLPLNFELGQAYLLTEQIDLAEKMYAEILTLSPKSSLGLQGKALILLSYGKFNEANKLALQINAQAQDKKQSIYLLAQIATKQGNEKLAFEYYNTLLSDYPDHYQGRMDRAKILITQQRYQLAVEDCDYLIEHVPYDAESHYLRGLSLSNLGDKKTAQQAFSLAQELVVHYQSAVEQGHSPTILLVASIAQVNGKLTESLIYYNKYLKNNSNNLIVRKTIAKLYIQLNDAQEAVDLFKYMNVIQLEDADLHVILGKAYSLLNEHQKAVKSFERALKINPDQSLLLANLGKSQFMLGDSQTGSKNLENVLTQQPKAKQVGIFLAMQYFRDGKLNEAERVTSSLLAKEPDNLSVLSIHASILASVGKLTQARASFDKVLSIKPDFRSAQLNLIKIDLKEGKVVQARKSLDALLINAPSDTILLYEQVKLEEALGNKELAISLLLKMHNKNKGELAIDLHLIELYLFTRQADKAIELAEDVLYLYPKNVRVLKALGKAHLLAGDKQHAKVLFTNMGRLSSVTNHPTQLFEIAILQVQADDLAGARFTLNKVIELQPNFYTAIVSLTELEIQAGRLKLAEELILQLKALAPNNPVSSLLEGNLANKEGNKKRAVKAYTVANKGINSDDSAMALFKALIGVGKVEQGIEVLTLWSKQHPRRNDMKAILADIAYQMGKNELAVNHYEDIIATGVENGTIYSKLALIYDEQGNNEALALAKKAYVLSPTNVDTSDTYGWLLTKNNQAKEGLSLLRDALSRESSSPVIHYHLAVTLEQLNFTRRAINAYDTALSFNEDFKGKEDAIKRSKELSQNSSVD